MIDVAKELNRLRAARKPVNILTVKYEHHKLDNKKFKKISYHRYASPNYKAEYKRLYTYCEELENEIEELNKRLRIFLVAGDFL